VYIKHGVISTLISLLTSRITEGKKRIVKEMSRNTRTTTVFRHKTLNLKISAITLIGVGMCTDL